MQAYTTLKNLKEPDQELAKDYEVHPVQVSDWIKKIPASSSDVLATGQKQSTKDDFDVEKEQLHAKIGKQAVEIDYLQKTSKQLCL